MRNTTKQRLALTVGATALALASVLFAGTVLAGTQFLGDGAVRPTNNTTTRGGWDLPLQGSCPADGTATTRPACVARRYNLSGAACVSPTYSLVSATSGACTDTLATTQSACLALPDRYWNDWGGGTGVCAIVLMDDDRNAVSCMKHNGTWQPNVCTGNWVMPSRTAYTPNLLTSDNSGSASPGDSCLRCHNTKTQYNTPRVRDTEDTLYMGHKNMVRPVTVGRPWGGPSFTCSLGASYPTEESCLEAGGTWEPTNYSTDDSGNPIDWSTGKITVSGAQYDLTWIYGDWIAEFPRAIYAGPASTTANTCTDPRGSTTNCSTFSGTVVKGPGATYSCGRCHATGWTSDATAQPSRDPLATFGSTISAWTHSGDAGANQVNLAGGVANDANYYSSWDYWGISCSRCHSSAVSNTGGGGPFSAPTGMSSHHSNLTAADYPGWCSNSSKRTQADCALASATWFNGYCTDPRFLGTGGISPANAKIACETAGSGSLAKSSPGAPAGTWITPCSNNSYADQAGCVGAGATWVAPASSSCSVAGLCNDPAITTAGACTGTVASGPLTGLVRQWQAATDIVTCVDAGGKYTGSNSQRGQIITALCMDCHRQENKGYPYVNGSCTGATATNQGDCVNLGGTWGDTGNGLPVVVAAYHNTVTFPSHPAGNQFLNSPHGKFTGKFSDIATGTFNYGMTGLYKSFFQTDSEAANTGAGCTTCHEVHTSTTSGEKPFRAECTECHKKNLNAIKHPAGIGTPLEKMATDPMEPCVVCHMPGGQHSFRINVAPTYSTLPVAAAMAATSSSPIVTANTSPDGTFTNAVWVDLDLACGQCHGGGASTASTTGSISANSATLTVASATGLVANEKIRISGAGAFTGLVPGPAANAYTSQTACLAAGYAWSGSACQVPAYFTTQPTCAAAGFTWNYVASACQMATYGDFDTYIKTIAGTTVTLGGKATHTVANAAVVQNAVSNNAAYFPKATLAGYAAGIHNDVPNAQFDLTRSGGLTVNVDATRSTCSGSNANCNVFSWNWGDGTTTSNVTSSHTYANPPAGTPATYTITLTVTQYGIQPGTASQTITVSHFSAPPVAAGNCTYDYTAWTASCTNTGLAPDAGYRQVFVNWGDGTVLSNIMAAPWSGPFTHTFLAPGSYSINLNVIDQKGQQSRATIGTTVAGNFVYSSVNGFVYKNLPGTVSEVQSVTVTGTDPDTFSLTFNGQTTTALSPIATAAQVQTALNALSSIGGVGGSVSVGLATGVYTVTFGGTLAGTPLPQMTSTVTGGVVAAVATVQDGVYGTTPIGAAQILLKKSGVLVKTLMTLADGSYSVGTIKPGTYTLTVSKSGYTFTTPTQTITLPGTASPVNFYAN